MFSLLDLSLCLELLPTPPNKKENEDVKELETLSTSDTSSSTEALFFNLQRQGKN